MLQLIGFFTAVSLIFSRFIKRWKYYHGFYHLPGPTVLSIISSAFNLLCQNKEWLWKIDDEVQKYPHPMRLWIWPQIMVVFSDPQHVEVNKHTKILTSNKFSHKDNAYEFLKPILGDGLVTASGQKWKSHTKIIQPLLNSKFINHSFGVFRNKLVACLQNLDAHVD